MGRCTRASSRSWAGMYSGSTPTTMAGGENATDARSDDRSSLLRTVRTWVFLQRRLATVGDGDIANPAGARFAEPA